MRLGLSQSYTQEYTASLMVDSELSEDEPDTETTLVSLDRVDV